jgi:hypothetical protein
MMVCVSNLDINLESCFVLYFIITKLSNLDANLGINLCCFNNDR